MTTNYFDQQCSLMVISVVRGKLRLIGLILIGYNKKRVIDGFNQSQAVGQSFLSISNIAVKEYVDGI